MPSSIASSTSSNKTQLSGSTLFPLMASPNPKTKSKSVSDNTPTLLRNMRTIKAYKPLLYGTRQQFEALRDHINLLALDELLFSVVLYSGGNQEFQQLSYPVKDFFEFGATDREGGMTLQVFGSDHQDVAGITMAVCVTGRHEAAQLMAVHADQLPYRGLFEVYAVDLLTNLNRSEEEADIERLTKLIKSFMLEMVIGSC